MLNEIYEKANSDEFAFLRYPTFNIEQYLFSMGYNTIAGVDEAGRGSLAGPLALGMVVFNREMIFSDDIDAGTIDDSKKMTHRKRVEVSGYITQKSDISETILVSHCTIDKIDNINRATEYALIKMLRSLPVIPDIVIMDGNFKFNIPAPFLSIKKGDAKSISIAGASILAKVRRDSVMVKLSRIYPGYSFESNKGYGTKKHIDAIKNTGCCPIHRKTYEPVRSLYEN